MIAGRGSKTAVHQARLRATESLAPNDARVCNDPLAVEFLDERARRAFQVVRNSRFWTGVWLWMLHRDPSGTKAEGIARTRYIDDYLRAAVANGIEQVVILGAGCDSRAYRIKALERITVFEVDHPDTQKAKITNLKRVLGQLPPWVRYVPVDFAEDSVHAKLVSTGYSTDAQTLFIWEGVTMYLTADAVNGTLSFVAGHSGRRSLIIFNYWYKSAVDGSSQWKWARAIQRRAARLGEPITFGIEGDKIEEFLAARGFVEVKRVTPAVLNGLYFHGANAKRKVCPFAEIVHATVGSSRR